MATKKTEQFNAVGRRKKSIARVKMIPNGTGVITINARDINDYFALDTFKFIVRQPLELVNLTNKVDIIVRVNGGGVNGQAGAIRLGIARNLVKMDENMKKRIERCRIFNKRCTSKRT